MMGDNRDVLRLDESDDVTCESKLASLTQWAKEQRLDQCNQSFLLRFLRARKFDEERTKILIANYYDIRGKIPEWFCHRDPLNVDIQNLLKVFVPLPGRDCGGRQIIFCRPGLFDVHYHKTNTLMKMLFMIIDLLLDDDLTQLNGFVFVVDLSGFTFSHLTAWTPSVIKKTLSAWQDAYPIRVRALHHFNEPFLFDALYAIIKPFLKNKMINRFYLHGKGTDNLMAYLSKDVLPIEYGGTSDVSLDAAEASCKEMLLHGKF